MSNSNQLKNIGYISLPENFKYKAGSFELDSKINLPIEIDPDSRNIEIDELTWDSTIAAMLKILAHEPLHPDAEYYKRFILAAKPTILDELNQAGLIKTHNNNYELAEEIFLSASSLEPENTLVLLNLAFLYEQQAEACLEENPRQSDALILKAVKTYRKVFVQDPSNSEANYNLGFHYTNKKMYSKARLHLENYIKHGKDELRKSQALKIIDNLTKLLLEDENFKTAYNLISTGLENKGIEEITSFVAKHPTIWQGYFLLGWGLRRSGEYLKAKHALKKALFHCKTTETGILDTLNELAICHLELEEYSDAKSSLIDALKCDPENTKVRSNLGILALKCGKLTEAKIQFEKILEDNPEDPLAKQFIEKSNI